MKKMLFLGIVLWIISALSCAYATEIINPYFESANHLPGDGISSYAASDIRPALTLLNEPVLNQDIVFQASASGGSGNYQYRFYVLNPDMTSEEYPFGDPNGHRNWDASPTYSYRFVTPGNYLILAYAMDSRGVQTISPATLSLTIKDSSAPTTQSVINDLVRRCLAAGCETDYEKALWFHDWLTENAYYDLTFSYYSADGVLIRGCGVCDSYAKAYTLLLDAVNIDSVRVTNTNHAWNLVKLDGQWYHIDPTWDDPVLSGHETDKLSGAEYHMYFGLPDTLMRMDRTFDKYTGKIAANGRDDNYYLRSGKVSLWTNNLKSQINDALTESGYGFDLALPNYYSLENGRYSSGKEVLVYNICAYALEKNPWPYDGQHLPIEFTYYPGSKSFIGNIRFTQGNSLTLPGGLIEISQDAFSGGGKYLCVTLPDGLTTLGPGTFSNNTGLWKITIPDSVTEIDSTAFSGCTNLTIHCSGNSAALAFAKAHDFRWKIDE